MTKSAQKATTTAHVRVHPLPSFRPAPTGPSVTGITRPTVWVGRERTFTVFLVSRARCRAARLSGFPLTHSHKIAHHTLTPIFRYVLNLIYACVYCIEMNFQKDLDCSNQAELYGNTLQQCSKCGCLKIL